jgi:aminoglycoside phosphotransferase (APT) family kinase protein
MTSGPDSVEQGSLTASLADIPALTTWLDEHIPSLGDGPLETQMIHGGTSNVILSLRRGEGTMVLRRPPAVPPPNSEKSIMREARVLTAINGTNVPHPFCYGICEDASVIGAPFYVMELVQGWSGEIHDQRIVHRPPFNAAPYEYGMQYAMVDGIVALANVDHVSVGLADFGKPDNFLERQVDRWAGQLASYERLYGYPSRVLPGYDIAEAWLRANVPQDSKVGILHGDMGTPNALFAFEPPAKLNALIDWELSTIGDPMLDLGWMGTGLRDERSPDRPPPGNLYAAENMPTRQELARYYAAGTGRDVSTYDYFVILALFKAGCLLEYKVAQAAAGLQSKETGEMFSRLVAENFVEAEWIIRQMG